MSQERSKSRERMKAFLVHKKPTVDEYDEIEKLLQQFLNEKNEYQIQLKGDVDIETHNPGVYCFRFTTDNLNISQFGFDLHEYFEQHVEIFVESKSEFVIYITPEKTAVSPQKRKLFFDFCYFILLNALFCIAAYIFFICKLSDNYY